MALLDNGTQINIIMPGFIEHFSLDVGPLSDLIGRQVACIGPGECTHSTYWLCHHTGSSRQSPGL